MRPKKELSRREFLKISGVSLSALALTRFNSPLPQVDFPASDRLGRATATVTVRTRPDINAPEVATLYQDAVFPWLREVIGRMQYQRNHRWVETTDGFIWSGNVQPVWNNPQADPVQTLFDNELGKGMWVEVCVPYVDLYIANPPARSPWLESTDTPRLYYSQVVWVDEITTNSNGLLLYHINEPYGSYGDMFWADARAFRRITPEEISPIHPEGEDKHVYVDVARQTLSCFEGNREVYFCRASTGAKFNASGEEVEGWSTPTGNHPTWRKLVSLHMAGGATGLGWDLPGIAWTALFVGSGVAIHSTFWHNNYGTPMSHGCVNLYPDDAKWVWRWMEPQVSYYPGDIQVDMNNPGTYVEVVED